MNLIDLIEDIPYHSIQGDIQDTVIYNLTDDSRTARAGSLFFAINGYDVDGHMYIHQAIDKGAVVIIGEQEFEDLPVPYIKVPNSRKAVGQLAKRFYGNPLKGKKVIGVTGTNGKTTTTSLLKHIFEENGKVCSLIGTNGYSVNGESLPSQNTTPSALRLYEILKDCQDEIIVMEVSSHGLTQHRLEGVEFDVCVFTNLTHEHLDYHDNMHDYFNAKKKLFDQMKKDGLAVVNVDDEWGVNLYHDLNKQHKKVCTVGRKDLADISISATQTVNQPVVTLSEQGEEIDIEVPLPGLHNLYNATLAYAVAKNILGERKQIINTIKTIKGVPGRFEILQHPSGVKVVLDYAHTPDAIYHSLQTAKDAAKNRLIHVFGFRGNRDRSKRRDMINLSSQISDFYILTMDDLNSVSFEEMLKELSELNLSHGRGKGEVVPDRTLAIQKAIDMCRPGDWVIITGRGHEAYQQAYELGTMSDRETIMPENI
ncbi:UDP-N-acetylmuramoyl-L-alanyl-D-glutamate--2,6-diaminopimelate ligase [Alkalibacillus aidingensis]|uniref:UDP-N-acetylmuramoyl-L-alanyl-D-glutamate--2, 6-diaminopimelate ligase n=1 Tax=Alkalibacillus aidingensis TaxID=2747607 RepID=UPI0016615AD3|nr:UDP-N-acetylmuramoyl-L-alanyl-D-glutamate--2,6-diaminopimelate ligase [Alkalibacillus aidingensis]